MTAEYQTVEKAIAYLAIADRIPERTSGEKVVLALLPANLKRVLDLGTGDGRLMSLIRLAHPGVTGVATDFSPTMIEHATKRFEADSAMSVVAHDFNTPITQLGEFDAIVSSFAIHHVDDARKRDLYAEVFSILSPGGVFINLEHVSSPTEKLHDDFLKAMGQTRETEDKSNQCSPVSIQLGWLSEIGFIDVDCFWKWRELAILAGTKPLKH